MKFSWSEDTTEHEFGFRKFSKHIAITTVLQDATHARKQQEYAVQHLYASFQI
jgi:hypothetical protein